MCGIMGAFGNPDVIRTIKYDQTTSLEIMRHRGPDDRGFWSTHNAALGMVRLSIIDLSLKAHQPMSNEDGTIWLVLNGEIYNYKELRNECLAKGHILSSDSDTETVIHLYEVYGLDCLSKLRGMYAFAIWDSRKSVGHICLDPLGIKPLYYREHDGALIFASEIKSILTMGLGQPQINYQATHDYFQHLYIPAPETIYNGIHRLEPGSYLSWVANGIKHKQYWDLHFEPDNDRSKADTVAQCGEALQNSVRAHMVSDVPVGVLLSGGLDSSTITAMAAQTSEKPIKTFTLGFSGVNQEWDETKLAKLLVEKYGTEHHVLDAGNDLLEYLPSIVWHFDQPFGNPTALLNAEISRLCREHVTVVLAGTGGDECFGGYPRYWATKQLKRYFKLPLVLRSGIGKAGRFLFKNKGNPYDIFSRYSKFFKGLDNNPSTTYARWQSYTTESEIRQLILNATAADRSTFVERLVNQGGLSFNINNVLYADIKSYLPYDLLNYSDVTSMANSIEMRVPFCDKYIMEYSATIPWQMKINGRTTKAILREIAKPLLPPEYFKVAKRGFSAPLLNWLRGDKEKVVKSIITKKTCGDTGLLNPDHAVSMVSEFYNGGNNRADEVYAILVFILWHTIFMKNNWSKRPDYGLSNIVDLL